MRKITTFKCPECGMKFSTMSGWSKHIKVHHPTLIPEGYSDMRFLYFCETGRTCGHCIQCGHETTWNESNGKYNRFCNNPKCKQEYTKIAKQRMIDKYGKEHLLNDPNMQRKMLKNKGISGTYKFSNKSGQVDYVGSYEKDFLYIMDHMLGFSAKDIMGPSPHNYIYMYEGKAHVYIPDFYIPNYNLEIEIKTDENMHHKIQKVDKEKERLKDEVMNKNPNVNYFKILDKDYTEFFKYLTDKKFEIDDAAMENINKYINDPKIRAAMEDVLFPHPITCKNTVHISDDLYNNWLKEIVNTNKSGEEPAEENVILPKKDGTYNLDKWKPGPHNILFITGFSGSGKTTMAEAYEKKYNAIMFEIDGIQFDYDTSNKGLLNKIYKQFPNLKKLIADFNNGKGPWPDKMIGEAIKYLIRICHEDKDNLYVIEGIQIACVDESNNLTYINSIKGEPLIVKGTSALTSSIRAANRNAKYNNEKPSLNGYVDRLQFNMPRNAYIEGIRKAAATEASLPAEDRTDFGIPSMKKYPMPDAKHVKLAIKFFNYVDKEHEQELATNIKKYAKKYGVKLEAGENNRFSNYI
jgi:deoxyadenosine/deoxycytidine kinase